MSKSESIKQQYLDQVRSLLGDERPEFLQFQNLWNEGRLREAYLFVDRWTRENGIEPSQEFKNADEAFYWDFVN